MCPLLTIDYCPFILDNTSLALDQPVLKLKVKSLNQNHVETSQVISINA